MGKKRSAARRATATAAAASAATPSPAVPFDAHAALVDTPSAPAVRESPTNTQQPRVSHEADAIRAPRAASPAHLPVDTTLVREPAASDARADTSVAIATPQALVAHAFEPCPEPDHSPRALTTPTSTSSDVSASSPQQPRVSNHANTITVLRPPFPALSALAAAAAADLASAIDVLGPPTVFLVCPTHSSCRAEDFGHELDTRAPRTCPATSIEDIDEGLLANIIEDAQNQTRIDARREVRVKALQEGRERGWKEGLEEGRREARREARRDANTEMRQQEQGWKDAYELGRWDGYREGLEVARIEVSTSSCVDSSVQADDTPHTPSPTTETSTAASHVDAGVQFSARPHPFPSPTDSRPPIPIDTVPATPHANAHVQTDDHVQTLSPPIYACITTPRVNPAIPRVDAGIQADAPAPTRIHDIPSPRVHTGVQSDACGRPSTPPNKTYTTRSRVQASTQTDTPHSSAPAHARIVQEIEPGLLTDILAKAIARGEAAGLKKGKQVGFLDGMEAGWKSGTKEGHEDGYREGKQSGINEGRAQYRLEVSRIPRAVAAVQTDHTASPTRINSTTQTAPPTIVPHTNNQHCTIVSLPVGTVNTPPDSFTPPSNSMFTSNNNGNTFSWADDTSLLPITTTSTPVLSCVPRDFSVLRSSSHHPFDSLKRRARRSQTRPAHLSRPPRPLILNSEPIVTRRHPAGLRADRPSVVVSSSPLISHPVKLEVPPLDWQGDPRLQELGRVLRGLGWVHGSAS